MDDRINQLYWKYRNRSGDPTVLQDKLSAIYRRFLTQRGQTVIDTVTSTVALQQWLLSDTINFDNITPQMKEAWNLAYPTIPLNSLPTYDPSQMQGFVNGWKGKYFEVLVRDKLNSGEWVGDIHLEPGQVASLAASSTQSGWDLQIFNDDGLIADQLQMKATDSLSYIAKALEKYDSIDVVSTDEVFEHSVETLDQLHSSGFDEDDLENMVVKPMLKLFDSPLKEFLEDKLPFLPFLIIVGTEGHAVIMGRKSYQKAFASAGERSLKSAASMSVGSFVVWLGGGYWAIPATMLTRLGFDRVKIQSITNKAIERNLSALKPIELRYRPHIE